MDEATRAQALDLLMVIITLVALGVGLLSIGLGRFLALYDWARARLAVNHSASAEAVVMSQRGDAQGAEQPVAVRVDATRQSARQPIAKPGNAVNRLLADSDVDEAGGNIEDDISAARKIIQYRAKLELLADLVNSEVVGQTEGIEKGFKCSRSGRKDSKYAQVRADLQPLLKPVAPPPKFAPEPPEVEAFREQLRLPEKV